MYFFPCHLIYPVSNLKPIISKPLLLIPVAESFEMGYLSL